ncbi:glutathione peroxidase [soil metagenome]
MTVRQSLMKLIYPLVMLFSKKNRKHKNTAKVIPHVSFYALRTPDNKGDYFSFQQLRGKKVLLVNTASDCGFTGQYEELQKLSDIYKNKLVIIAFPANDFKDQEKGSDDDIAAFCKINYGINFPLMKKSSVIKGDDQNPVFAWLTNEKKNGWNNQQPTWNFSKYLVNENGLLTDYFSPTVSPLAKEVKLALKQAD